DEVITSAQSFFTVPNMIIRAGARPVFVDCDLVTRNIDLAQVEQAITPRTKVIIPTHFPGSLVDMDSLYTLARRHSVRVIEDAALVMGSRWNGRPVGSFGDLATFSFHPNKNITTIEGGALVVNDEREAKLFEKLRFHGIVRVADGTRDVECAGGKFNLSDVSARLGLAQFARLDEFLARRRMLVDHYFAHFHSDPPCELPPRPARPDDGQSWNMFCVLLPLDRLRITRAEFIEAMRARSIGIGISYEALHLTSLGHALGHHEGEFPNTERIARETVTLPLFPAMETADVERVCDAAREILDDARP
ncbi:MAG TPA: DegT/DnrJ/EryC1/StrS aminotransferase family protein, partial [Burkholderiales bacterium]|nr:DegT/DnrJ/EryC1/StrS aminotransferase family protein [Burkholderiales bacterium]